MVARRVYELLASRTPSRGVRLSLAHAKVMDALFTDGDAGIGMHWPGVARAVDEAREAAATAQGGARELLERYELLRTGAEILQEVKEWRAFDELSRPRADGTYDSRRVEATLLLLVLEGERARHCADRRPTIALLQQSFGVWALWRLQLRQQAVPPDHAGSWANLLARRSLSSLPATLSPGRPFPNFVAFALFAIETWSRGQAEGPGPERGIDDTIRALRHMRLLDNGEQGEVEHGVWLVDALDRWMTAAIRAAPGPASRRTLEQLRDVVRPLPLMSIEGALSWDV